MSVISSLRLGMFEEFQRTGDSLICAGLFPIATAALVFPFVEPKFTDSRVNKF